GKSIVSFGAISAGMPVYSSRNSVSSRRVSGHSASSQTYTFVALVSLAASVCQMLPPLRYSQLPLSSRRETLIVRAEETYRGRGYLRRRWRVWPFVMFRMRDSRKESMLSSYLGVR
ncbi:hypothetical protein N0V92_011499, partial [Colletotrichum tropicale]